MFKTTGRQVYRLIGDDQLDDRQRVEHRDGSDVPGGGRIPHSQNHSDRFTTSGYSSNYSYESPHLSDMLSSCVTAQKCELVLLGLTWSLSSPEVDLVFLAENPLVFASQVRHTQELLQQRKGKEGGRF